MREVARTEFEAEFGRVDLVWYCCKSFVDWVSPNRYSPGEELEVFALVTKWLGNGLGRTNKFSAVVFKGSEIQF